MKRKASILLAVVMLLSMLSGMTLFAGATGGRIELRPSVVATNNTDEYEIRLEIYVPRTRYTHFLTGQINLYYDATEFRASTPAGMLTTAPAITYDGAGARFSQIAEGNRISITTGDYIAVPTGDRYTLRIEGIKYTQLKENNAGIRVEFGNFYYYNTTNDPPILDGSGADTPIRDNTVAVVQNGIINNVLRTPNSQPPIIPPIDPGRDVIDPDTPREGVSSYVAELHYLGLFTGDAGGYRLNERLNRVEALILTLRMFGLYEESQTHSGESPFIDTGTGWGWARPIIGFGREHGITQGVAPDRFDPGSDVTFAQFTTFTLRALGYNNDRPVGQGGDFEYSTCIEFALSIGLYDQTIITVINTQFSEATNRGQELLRAGVVLIMVQALQTEMKNSSDLLIETLFDEEKVQVFLEEIELVNSVFTNWNERIYN